MEYIILIIIYISTSLTPVDYQKVNIEVNKNATIELKREENGYWKTKEGRFRFDGMVYNAGNRSLDMSKIFSQYGFDDNTDWSKVTEFSDKNTYYKIIHIDKGFNFQLGTKGDPEGPMTIKIRWDAGIHEGNIDNEIKNIKKGINTQKNKPKEKHIESLIEYRCSVCLYDFKIPSTILPGQPISCPACGNVSNFDGKNTK